MASNKYDYKFRTEPANTLKCCICSEVAKEQPMQHDLCGKLFCSECIEKNENKPCPHCLADNPKYFSDIKSSQEIKALQVRCDNCERGCKWKGTVGTFEDHVIKCAFTLVSCPNKCKADGKHLQLMRKDLDGHLKTNKCPNRSYSCKHCGVKNTYAYMTEVHNDVCLMKIVSCPNKCSLNMQRAYIDDHIQLHCDYTVVSCKYESVGCSVKKMRKDMKPHEEDTKSHLHLSLTKIVMLDSAVSSSESEMDSLKSEMTVLKKDFKKLEASVLNDVMSLKLSDSSLKRVEDTTSSLKDTTSSLKMDADTLNKEKLITFKMSQYSEKKKGNAEASPEPFFTSPDGYRMCIQIYPNGYGDGEATHLSVYSKILKGPYDDELHWPFKGTVTIELLNQLADTNHHSMIMNYFEDKEFAHAGGSGWGYGKFLPHSKLSHDPARKTQYLMEDTLYFRVTVKVKNHKPWLDCTHHTK